MLSSITIFTTKNRSTAISLREEKEEERIIGEIHDDPASKEFRKKILDRRDKPREEWE